MIPRVLALDISITATGICKPDGVCFTSKGGKEDARFRRLYDDVYRVAEHADLVIVEDLPLRAMSAALTGRAHGVVRMALADLGGRPVVSVVASTLKKYATGNGKASKEEMVEAANTLRFAEGMRFGWITDHNEADAFCLYHLGTSWLRGGGKARSASVAWSAWEEWLNDQGNG